MSVEHHDFMCGQNWSADAPYFLIPECSCGWEGRRGVETIEEAQEVWGWHCEDVFEKVSDARQALIDGYYTSMAPLSDPPVSDTPTEPQDTRFGPNRSTQS